MSNQAEASKRNVQGAAVREMTQISLFVAMLAISAYIVFPLPFTPAMISGQTLMINLVALTLPPKQTLKTMAVYLALGLMGLPVFSGGSSGLGKLLGPTGGYLVGFLVAAVMMSALRKGKGGFKRNLAVTLAGIPVIYFFGALQMSLVLQLNLRQVFLTAVLPFIPGDIFKCAAASFMAVALDRVRRVNRA